MSSATSRVYPLTFADQLATHHNRPSGFDYIRLVLAIGVIIWHVFVTSYGMQAQTEALQSANIGLFAVILPMFFSLSGFLVAGSLERSPNLFSFLWLRLLRIAPALSVEVLLSALILGPIFTTLPLSDYFSSPQTRAYFLNIVGDVHFYLPNVFQDNPHDMVNGQIWTIPWELYCYISLSVIAACSIYHYRLPLLMTIAALYIMQLILESSGSMLSLFGTEQGIILVISFLCGIALYRLKENIPFKGSLFLLALVLSLFFVGHHTTFRFSPIPIAYMTVYLGLLNPPRNKILLSGDYSYGLFLYGYPIQQALVDLGPAKENWVANLLLAIPCTTMFAVASWWLVEKRVLGLKKRMGWINSLNFLKLSPPPTDA